MAHFGAPFTFPFGGQPIIGDQPWIIDYAPSPGDFDISLLDPIRFSIRDTASYVDTSLLRIDTGYASVHSDGAALFDSLPRTTRRTLKNAPTGPDPHLQISSGVVITKTTSSAQRSVYTTAIDVGSAFPSFMITAIIHPTVLGSVADGTPPPINGPVMGIENGRRNKVVYLWFQNIISVGRILRLTSFLDPVFSPDVNDTTLWDWSVPQRYTMVWDEARGYVEVFSDLNNETTLLFSSAIDDIPAFEDSYYARTGGAGDIVGIYGQEGTTNDSSTWSNIAMTADVGFPVVNGIRTGDFVTKIVGSELIRTIGSVDPREAPIACWFEASSDYFPATDVDGVEEIVDGAFSMTKVTDASTLAVMRVEPGFLLSISRGFMVQGVISADNTALQDSATGTGIIIYDGLSVFLLQLFQDASGSKTVGIRKRGGSDFDLSTYYQPTTPLDWSKTGFRLVADTPRNKLQLFSLLDLTTPILDIALDRGSLPVASEFSYTGLDPFIAFGHILPTNTAGTFSLNSLDYCHFYQSWEAREGDPTLISNPYTATSYGFLSLADDVLTITTPPGDMSFLYRQAFFGTNRGAIIEASLRIPSYRPLSRTGVYLALDGGPGNYIYALSFSETSLGRFASLELRNQTGDFRVVDLTGIDGAGSTNSFLVDWTEYHTYRLELRAYDGLYVFLDNETTPRITLSNRNFSTLPDNTQTIPSTVFGHLTQEGATSDWLFVRGFYSVGYEISFQKKESVQDLQKELTDTQAIVIAYVAGP